MRRRVAGLLLAAGSAAASAQAFTIVGDGIPQPLTAEPGDPARGRAVVASRTTGLCLLCHPAPMTEQPLQGNLGPDLAGAGARWTEPQLRLRIVDSRALNPQSIMPAMLRTEGLQRVGAAWAGRPILTPQQVEDVVAWLRTLRE